MEEYKTKKINLFGTIWTIKFVKHILKREDSDETFVGMTYHARKFIEVSITDDDGNPINKEEIKLNLLHELMHACFGEGQYWDCNNNEQLVEWMAKCFREIFNKNVLK